MSHFPPHLLNEIKKRIQLSDLVGRYVRLQRAGQEWRGLSPFQKERSPSFYVNNRKEFYHCFSSGQHGDHFDIVMHKEGVTFPEAVARVAALVGVPVPEYNGRPREMSAEEIAERRQREEEHERYMARRAAVEARRKKSKKDQAISIWNSRKPIVDTLADRYFISRGIVIPEGPWHDCLGFVEDCEYEFLAVYENGEKVKEGPRFPCIAARVDDMMGDITAIWRIFLNPETGAKNSFVPNAKLGLGPAAGGAVRLGGVAPRIGIGEGLETCLGALCLTKWRYPIWPTLSTSGMIGFEPPIDVERIRIFPDGDKYREKDDGSIALPPGRVAAHKLRDKLKPTGIDIEINQEPRNADYLDVWNKVS